MTRRRPRLPLAAAILALLLLLVAACGSKAATSSTDGASGGGNGDVMPALDPDCPVGALDHLTVPLAITVSAPLAGPARDALDIVVTRYNVSHPMVHVTVAANPTDADGQRTLYRQQVATATVPDVVAVDSSLTQTLVDTGTVASATACRKAAGQLDDHTLPVVDNSSTVDRVVWASSASPSTQMLFFRRSAFVRAGLDPEKPPRTLDDLTTQARKLKEADATAPPLVLPLDSALIENWITGASATIVDHSNGHEKAATKALFDNPRTLELYQWIQQMTAEGLVTFDPPAVGQPTTAPETALTQAAMVVAPSSSIAAIATATTASAPDLDVAPLPGLDGPGRGQVGGLSWFATNTGPSSTRAAAWDFLTFLNSTPSQVVMNVTGSYLPNNTLAAEDPVLSRVWEVTRRGPWLDTAYTQLTNLDPSGPGPLIGPYPEVRTTIVASLAGLLAGRAPQDVITEADQAITADLAAYHPDHS